MNPRSNARARLALAIMPGRLWTVEEAAFLLQLSASSVRTAIRDGALVAEKRLRYAGNPHHGPFYRRLTYYIPDEELARYRVARVLGARRA